MVIINAADYQQQLTTNPATAYENELHPVTAGASPIVFGAYKVKHDRLGPWMKPATKVLDAEDRDPRAGRPTLEDKSVFFRFKEKFLSLCLQHMSPNGDPVKDPSGPLTYHKYAIARLQYEDTSRTKVKRGADGTYQEEGTYHAGGVTHMVHVCSLVNKTWNQTANGNELWKLFLRRHALRNTYIGFGGLRGLYDNHIVFGNSGLESRIREGAWHKVDRLKYPRTRGQCADAASRPEAQIEVDVPRSLSLPSPVATVRASGDQIAALTVQGQLFTWKADHKSAGRPLSVPGLSSKRVTVMSEYGAAATEDGELWAFAVDRTAMSTKLCRQTVDWLDIKAEGCVAFRCRPGIAALVTAAGSLYTWRPDSTAVPLGRGGPPSEVTRVHVPRLKGASKAAEARLVAMNQQEMSDRKQLHPRDEMSSLKATWELSNELELYRLVDTLNREMGNPGHDLAVEQYVLKLGHNPGHAFGQLHLGVFYEMLNRPAPERQGQGAHCNRGLQRGTVRGREALPDVLPALHTRGQWPEVLHGPRC